MEISAERIVVEIEKVFLSPAPQEALEAFSRAFNLLGSCETFHIFQEAGKGDLAFLWAGFLYERFRKSPSIQFRQYLGNVLRLSNDLVGDIMFYLESAVERAHFLNPKIEKLIDFHTATKKHLVFQWKLSFGPYSSVREKLYALGVDGNYIMALGFKGKEIGFKLNSLEDQLLSKPWIRDISELNI